MDRRPLLNPAEIAQLRRDLADGYATVEAIQDPPPVVTFVRRDPATGKREPVTDAPVRLIRITFADREARLAAGGGGLVQYGADGELLAWEGTDVARGDRFTWQGHSFEVGQVYPARNGVVRAAVTLQT